MTRPDLSRCLVVGLGVTGLAVCRALDARGYGLLLADDAPDRVDASAGRYSDEVEDAANAGRLRELVAQSTAVVPSPGVPQHHGAYRLAEELGRPIVSELDLAAMWDDRPVVAITGTNGKTTVTTQVTTMLRRSGIIAEAAGNTETPLVDAIDATDEDVPRAEAFVVEASSFRLERVELFAPRAAAWLNLAPDHLDWHGDLESYAAAKARIFANQGPDDVAVVPVADDDVRSRLPELRARVVTFGLRGDVGPVGDVLLAHGTELVRVADMRRNRPHDLANGSAAAALALAMGAAREAVADELREFSGLPHRLQTVATIDGVTFHNDSKATAPHATLAALAGFDRAVLIAGGRNKDLDLGALAQAADRLVGVVAIGEAADEIEAAFSGAVPVERAGDMVAAVDAARAMAVEGGDVVLSPACASFDWYPGYEARGNHYREIVNELAAVRSKERTRP